MTQGRAQREMRPRVLFSLPRQHQDYFFEEIRRLCMAYLSTVGTRGSDRDSEVRELFSEVMAKLLGGVSSPSSTEMAPETGQDILKEEVRRTSEDAEELEGTVGQPISLTADEDPMRDGRVAWLIQETGNRPAIAHRHEDMRRQRWGRWHGTGYRTVQISALTEAAGGSQAADELLARHADASYPLQAEPEDPHDEADTRRVWRGLLALAERQFEAHHDVSLLLKLLAQDPEIQASFGSDWPITKIVEALNRRHPPPPWNADRVDNAKKRLRNWIGRMKRDHGLDSADLKDLLARHGREGGSEVSRSYRSSGLVQTEPLRKGLVP
jgi:hypothetical protein